MNFDSENDAIWIKSFLGYALKKTVKIKCETIL